jgi:hypothetical protein
MMMSGVGSKMKELSAAAPPTAVGAELENGFLQEAEFESAGRIENSTRQTSLECSSVLELLGAVEVSDPSLLVQPGARAHHTTRSGPIPSRQSWRLLPCGTQYKTTLNPP